MGVDVWLQDYVGICLIILTAVIIVLIVMCIVLFAKLRRLHKKYMQTMNGGEVGNVEEILIDIQERLKRHDEQLHDQSANITSAFKQMERMNGKLGIHRYNAFTMNEREEGGDLSFSIALLNGQEDGVVISSIYNREMCYIYAKPIVNGESTYALTPEEKRAIAKAVNE